MAHKVPAGFIAVAAYGSNTNSLQMLERVGPCHVLGTGKLEGRRLAFAGHSRTWGGAVATVVAAPGRAVPVVVYLLTPEQVQVLDKYEGVAAGVYRRTKVTVTTADGSLKATTYVHTQPEGGVPTYEYLRAIETGYRAFNLDQWELHQAEYEAEGLRKPA